MAMEMRQQLKMTQQLVMTPQLQLAIKLLQMTRVELEDVVRQELEENPLLEELPEHSEEAGQSDEVAETGGLILQEPEEQPDKPDESFHEVETGDESLRDWDSYQDGYNYSSGEYQPGEDDRPSFENMVTRHVDLQEHLLWQLRMGNFTELEQQIGAVIVGNLDADGYLQLDIAEIAAECQSDELSVEALLQQIQQFDPIGVAAKSLQECLLVQLRSMDATPEIVMAQRILQNYLPQLEKSDYRPIARNLKTTIDQVLEAVKTIACLDPRPGSLYSSEQAHYVSHDIVVKKSGDEYVVLMNEDGLPNLRLAQYYLNGSMGTNLDSSTREYIGDRKRAAEWLIKSIQQRQRTIYKVAKSIVRFQHDFLENGVQGLKPLVLRDVADDIGMHESTISRVTTNKYMQTPQGMIELKYFFTSGLATTDGDTVSSEKVKDRIKDLIEREDPRKPLSDKKIAELLSDETVKIARRTVTKYREIMRIGSSSDRRQRY
jgi:RNA polymerase sigma-54 factor